MIEIHRTYRPLIFAARCLAAPVVICSTPLYGAVCAGLVDWQKALSWENAAAASAIAYAVFILLPIQKTRPRIFWPVVALGALLAIGSTWLLYLLYTTLVSELLKGRLIYHIMASLLLLPFYAYIPITILNQKHETAHGQSDATNDRPSSIERESEP